MKGQMGRHIAAGGVQLFSRMHAAYCCLEGATLYMTAVAGRTVDCALQMMRCASVRAAAIASEILLLRLTA
jgi:hypothetical protein